jgi:TPP-dependent trihydroxycyclohexane-1,2-dione (THcHDO) dehydratase
MTTKEKAKELFCKMYGCEINTDSNDIYLICGDGYFLAKDCALIAVDEKYSGIINVIVDLKGRGCIDDKTFLKALDDMNTEWEEVKQEINNL